MRSGLALRRRPWALYAYGVLFMLFLYGPVLLLPLFSVNDSTVIALPVRQLTWRWYAALAADRQLIQALQNSLLVAGGVAVLATALGILAAWGFIRYRMAGQRLLIGFMLLPLVVPGLILGVSLLLMASSLGLQASLLTVALGHLVLCTPFALVVMMSRFEGMDRSLEEASRDLGSGPVATFFRIILPVAFPGVLSSLLMTFTISFDEFVLSLFLAGTETTLPVYMWSQLRFPNKLPSVMALGTLIFLASFLLIGIAERLRRAK